MGNWGWVSFPLPCSPLPQTCRWRRPAKRRNNTLSVAPPYQTPGWQKPLMIREVRGLRPAAADRLKFKAAITTAIKLARSWSPATLAQVLHPSVAQYNIVRELATCSQSQRTVQSMVSAHWVVSAACWLNASLTTGITDVAPPISLQLWRRSVASFFMIGV